MAAGTVAAMVLVPGTALAQEAPAPAPLEELANTLADVANSVGAPTAPGVPAAPEVPAIPAAPELPAVPAVPLDSDDDSPGHETPDPQSPDHGSGYVGDVNLGDSDILDLVKTNATVNDDGSTTSDVNVLSLLGGDSLAGSSSSSDGTTESHSNPTEGLCEALDSLLCLSLLYHDTLAEDMVAGAQGGVLSLCLLGDDPSVVTAYDCEGLLSAGAAEGFSYAERDGTTGHTQAESFNDLVRLCLDGSNQGWNEDFTCEGILGATAAHSDTAADSAAPADDRHSWLLSLDSDGNPLVRIEDPTAVNLLDPQCGGGGLAILCLFLNQGETILGPTSASNAQEALHLDVLPNDPSLVLAVLGQSESLAHLVPPPGCEPGEKGPCPPTEEPECSDGVDNDGDGKIDFPADPECSSADDDDESDGKKGAGAGAGLADTGADIAPLLAGAFLLIGMGALTVAATRRRVGKHTI
jgi:hypothetical protein